MADIQSNIQINVDTSNAMSAIRSLQSQISAFHQQMQKSGSAANAATSSNMQRNLINSVNATGKFGASMATVATETEAFTGALEKNKLSMGQYFRYAGASTKTFGRIFKGEFETINKTVESRVRTLQTQYIKMGRDANGAMKAIKIRPLSLDMQNLSTQTMIASQKQQIFNQLLRQGSTNLLNFGKNTQWAGRQLMVGFTVPLSIMGTTAIKEFQKIEEQVIKLKRVYGDMFTTDAEVEKAVESVRQLADEFTKYGIAVESTVGLAASVAQMGNVGSDMINQVTEATKLAVLGGMEQEKALSTTISLTNAFGIATEDLAGKINFLNAAENQTILAIDDFTEAVPKAGSVVSQLGGSVEDLAFFLTAMREGGVNASQAANALKSSLARLVNPTQQAQEDLGKLGIDILGIVENNVGDLRNTIFDLGDALDGLQPLERARALEELFGKFQFARMSTLFKNISREGSQAQEILRLTQSSAEELQALSDRELKRVEESPATKLQKQVEKLQAALAPIGAEFIKLITPLIEFLTDMLKKFNGMGEGAKSFVTTLVTVLGLIAPAAIMAFGLVANGIANLMKGFNSYRTLLQVLSGTNRDVTTQTAYMSQEQLEAASVAANLGQAHNYLAQQFTVEAAALSRLTDVYRAATAEQLRFNVAATGVPARPMRPPVVKTGARRASSPGGPVGYSNGVFSVPGPKGAGDIVPAMLSPGEAVIPAKQAQRYGGLIRSMIAGDIPGYEKGLQASHIVGALDSNDPMIMEQVKAMMPDVTPDQMKYMEVLGDATMDLPEWMNQDMRPSTSRSQSQNFKRGIDPDVFEGSMGSIDNKLLSTAQVAAEDVGLKLSQETLKGLSNGLEQDITKRAGDLARKTGAKVTDEILGQATNEVLKEAEKQGGDRGKLASGIKGRSQSVSAIRTKFSGLQGGEDAELRKLMQSGKVAARKGPRGGTELYFVDEKGRPGAKAGRFTGSKSRAAASKYYANAKTNAYGMFVDESGNPMSSPDEARMRGTSVEKSRVKGRPSYSVRRKNMVTEIRNVAALAREEAIKAFTQKAKETAKTASPSKVTAKVAKDTVDGYVNGLRQGKKKVATVAKETSQQELLAAEKAAKKQVTMARRQRRSQIAGRIAGGLGGASMALGMATMMPGVGDNPAMQAIQGLMPVLFGLSAVLPMLAALPLPLALLAGTLGAVVAGLTIWNKELKKTRAEYSDLGESLSSGTKVMDAFANAAGTVTATEIMDLRRKGVGDQVQYAVGKTPFAKSFFEGESGSEMLGSFEKASADLGKGFATDSFANQLSSAVQAGILSREQAGQLALELGNRINDFGVSVEIAAQLNELFGPNGEKLLNGDPLEIFINTSEKSVGSFTNNLEAALEGLTGGGFMREFLGLDEAAIEGFAAGSLVGFIQEQENAMNSFDLATSKSIESLKAQADELESQGKDATAIYDKIDQARVEADRNRNAALKEYANSFSLVTSAISGENLTLSSQVIDRLTTKAAELVDAAISMESMGGQSDPRTRQERINEQLQELKQAELRASAQIAQGGVLKAFGEGLKKQVEENLPESIRKAASGAIDSILNMEELSIPASLVLTTAIAGGNLNPATMGMISSMLTEQGSAAEATHYFEIIGEVMINGGPQAVSQMDAILSSIDEFGGTEEDQYQTIMLLLEQLRGLEGIDLSSTMDQLTFFSTFSSLLGEGTLINFLGLNSGERKRVQTSIDLMQELVDSTPDKPLTVDQVISQKIIVDESQLAAFKADAEFFEALDPVQQFLYIQRFVTIQSVTSESQAAASLRNRGVTGGGSGADRFSYSSQQIADEQARIAAETTKATLNIEGLLSATSDEDAGDGTGGGGPVGSILDSLLSKLKLVRDETVQVTKGWEASMSALQRLFGGSKTIKVFDGLQQQLRALGAGQGLIELIAGMDPDEFEEKKNDLFTIKDGQIVALKDAAISIGDALNSIKIGEFQNEQEQILADMISQETAFQMLRDAGLEVAEAYAVIADEALAAAIASGQLTDTELNELIRKVEEVREATDVSDAFESARKAIEKFNDDLILKANIAAYVDSGAFEQIQGTLIDGQVDGALAAAIIMKDEALSGLVAAGRAGSEEFVTRLQQLMGSSDFLQGVFDKGYANVQEAFRVQETKIRDDFETRLKEGTLADYDFNDLFGLDELSKMVGMSQSEIEELFKLKDPQGVIAEAQQQIATLNYEVDDLNAGIDEIQEKEDEINSKYDERVDALDKVQSAQSSIAGLQQAQLSVADALSRGDIAAAARAAQESREKEAAARLEQRKERIEQARERELGLVQSAAGQTREQIETRLRDLAKEIRDIEEEKLEPAQRLVDLSTLLIEKQLEYDTVLGMTREAWEDVKLEIDLAKISSDSFVDSIKAALAAVEALIAAYKELNKVIAGDDTDGGGSSEPAATTPPPATSPSLPPNFPPDFTPSTGVRTGGSEANDLAGQYEAEGIDWRAKAAEVNKKNEEKRDDTKAVAKVQSTIPKNSPNKAVSSTPVKTSTTTYNPGVGVTTVKTRQVKIITPYGPVYKTVRVANGGMINPQKLAMGGMAKYSMGGAVAKYAMGGMAMGTDTVPAMLTPGEFVIRRPAVQSIGKENLEKMNKTGTSSSSSVYNYSLEVNVKSDANPDQIARTVIGKIKQVDAQRVRGNRF